MVIAAMFGFAVWHLRRQAAERERAAAERLANFMAQSLPAAQAVPRATQVDGSQRQDGPQRQKLLMEAASKAGEAGEAALSIQLYARLLARYPDTSFAGLARSGLEEQKRKLAKP